MSKRGKIVTAHHCNHTTCTVHYTWNFIRCSGNYVEGRLPTLVVIVKYLLCMWMWGRNISWKLRCSKHISKRKV